jgi:hypothetical protein
VVSELRAELAGHRPEGEHTTADAWLGRNS